MPRKSDPIDKHVGARIRMRRTMLGMSQSALGDKLELSFQQVQKYEHGKNRVGPGRLLRIADILNVPVSSFYEGLSGRAEALTRDATADDLMQRFFSIRQGVALAEAFLRIEGGEARASIVTVCEQVAAANPAPKVKLPERKATLPVARLEAVT